MDFAFGNEHLGLRYVEIQGTTVRYDFWWNQKREFSGEYTNQSPLFLNGQELLVFQDATLYSVGIWWYDPVARFSAAFACKDYMFLMLALTYACYPELLPEHEIVQCLACRNWYIDRDQSWNHLPPCITEQAML